MNHRLAIAIEECSENIDRVAEHFGRCSKFIICEINSSKQVVVNETYFNPLSGHNEGQCQLPGYIKQFDVNTIITGGIGHKAVTNFHQYGIEVITAPGLGFNEALNLYLKNKLSGFKECLGHGLKNYHRSTFE